MKTEDVKVDKHYLYKGEVRRVLSRIQGGATGKIQWYSGILFNGWQRKQKKFLLDNGEEVYSRVLSEIPFNYDFYYRNKI